MADPDNTSQPPWIERASSVKLLCQLLVVVCVGLFLPDILDLLHIGYHKHGHYSAEGWLGFYAIFGFIAASTAAIAASKSFRQAAMSLG